MFLSGFFINSSLLLLLEEMSSHLFSPRLWTLIPTINLFLFYQNKIFKLNGICVGRKAGETEQPADVSISNIDCLCTPPALDIWMGRNSKPTIPRDTKKTTAICAAEKLPFVIFAKACSQKVSSARKGWGCDARLFTRFSPVEDGWGGCWLHVLSKNRFLKDLHLTRWGFAGGYNTVPDDADVFRRQTFIQ